MARRNFFAGLDIGSSTIRVVVAENGPEIIAAVEVPSDGVRKGAIMAPDVTARSIQKAFFELKKNFSVELDHAVVGIGEPRMSMFVSKGAVSVSRADGEVTKEDISRAIEASEAALPRLGNRTIVHSFPLFFTVDSDTHIRDALGLNGLRLEVETLFIAGFSLHLKNLLKSLELAGIASDEAVASPYAASFHALSKRQKEAGVLLLDVGAQTSSIAVFEEGALISLEIIPYGSYDITKDIGLGFKIDQTSAERVKRNLGVFLENGKKEIRLADFPRNLEEAFNPRKLREIVSARLGDIFELVEKHLKRIERSQLLPGGVVLVGGGARLFDIQTSAREELRLPAEISGGTPGLTGKKELVAGPEWTTALGLLRYGLAEHAPRGRVGSLLASPISKKISKWLRALIP